MPSKAIDNAPKHGWPVSRFFDVDYSAYTQASRENWFEECVRAIERSLEGRKGVRLAFPQNIGCGLAGGNWDTYPHIIRELATRIAGWNIHIWNESPSHNVNESGDREQFCDPSQALPAMITKGQGDDLGPGP